MVVITRNLAQSVQMVETLEMEDEVTQGVQINELDLVHVLLQLLLGIVLCHDPVGFH